MKKLILCAYLAFGAHLANSQPGPAVVVDNIAIAHEQKGWRVVDASVTPIHFNLIKGDLIVRIDGKNAAETGPMKMASLFNEGNRREIKLFIERGNFSMETSLREIATQDYDPIGAYPFKHVANGFNAPDAEFQDIDGKPHTLDEFKDKWLLIDFVATWCAPCMERLPKVLGIAEHNRLSLLTVALNDRERAVRRMQQGYNIVSPITMMRTLGQLPIDFGVTTNDWAGQLPALVLIRPDGEVALIHIGGFDANRIEKTIECQMSCKEGDEAVK